MKKEIRNELTNAICKKEPKDEDLIIIGEEIRKELTNVVFKEASKDGGLIFNGYAKPDYLKTAFILKEYKQGIAYIEIDYQVSVSQVSKVAAGIFSEKSNFCNLDLLIINYRNIRLEITKDINRKRIFVMIMTAMAKPEYKISNNNVIVNTEDWRLGNSMIREWRDRYLCIRGNKSSWLFEKMVEDSKSLLFKDTRSLEILQISSLKDGIITVEGIDEDNISNFISKFKSMFIPFSNMYGIKGIEIQINNFSVRVDDTNVDRILELYRRSKEISKLLEF